MSTNFKFSALAFFGIVVLFAIFAEAGVDQNTATSAAPDAEKKQALATTGFPGKIATKDDVGALIINAQHAYGCYSRDDLITLMVNAIEDHSRQVAELKHSGRCRLLRYGTVLRGVKEPLLADCYQLEGAPLPCVWVTQWDVARLTD